MTREDHRSHDALPAGTVLREYVIEEELGSGGFGIVYRARHEDTGGLVAMKEYVPREFAVRDGTSVHPRSGASVGDYESGLERFVREAGELERFQNLPGVVSVRGFFRANGTAYLVMNYEDGLPLSAFLERREAAGEPLAEDNLLAVVLPMLAALSVVHRAGVLHRDIKPGNIFLRRENALLGRPAEPVLIDFGAAKQNYLSRSRSAAPYTPGYAAFEQTSSMGEMGPWTDLYALGATMWRMVAGGNAAHVRESGTNPVDVLARNYALVRGEPDPMPSAADLGAGRISTRVLAAIDRCLALYPEDRPQDCEELLGLLGGATDSGAAESDVGRGAADAADSASASIPDAPLGGRASASRRRRSLAVWGLAAGVVAVAALFVYLSGGLGPEIPSVETGGPSSEEASGADRAAVPFTVETEPPEAAVEFLSIDERYRPGMPLLPGRYRVEASAPDHESRRAWLEHRSGARHEIVLERVAWAFIVETGPPGAAVRILNIAARYAPGMRLGSGDYRVEVSAPGYETAEESVGHGGGPTKRRIDLKKRGWRSGDVIAEELRSGGVGPEMAVISAGWFRMGCLSNDGACVGDEKPDHEVTIGRAFALGVREVTREEFGRFVDAAGHSMGNSCYVRTGGNWVTQTGRGWRSPGFAQSGSDPVVCVSWKDAKAYAAWLSGETGETYRLPSESEWEYAARAGSTAKYSWGNEIGDNRANCDGCGSRWDKRRTAPAGSFAPNDFGLYDMHGNAWEWVEDCWNASYRGAPSDGGAWRSGDCATRVLRGGSWYSEPRDLRAAYRNGFTTGSRLNSSGFRVARTLTP